MSQRVRSGHTEPDPEEIPTYAEVDGDGKVTGLIVSLHKPPAPRPGCKWIEVLDTRLVDEVFKR